MTRTTTGLRLLRAVAWLVPGLAGCVEIDPSYAESFTTTGAASTTDASSSSSAGSDDTAPAACDCGPLELCEDGACTAPARVLYINLDGVTTTFGNPDASQDVQGLYPEFATRWAPYGGDAATRQLLVSSIAEHWAPFRVIVTDVRPSTGPYMMAVVSGSPPPAGHEGFSLFAFPDCGDVYPQDIVFALLSPTDGAGAPLQAAWVSATIGRAFGLRYTEDPDDLMGYGTRFVDACYASADTSCASSNPELCNDPMQQNTYGELAAFLGTRE